MPALVTEVIRDTKQIYTNILQFTQNIYISKVLHTFVNV